MLICTAEIELGVVGMRVGVALDMRVPVAVYVSAAIQDTGTLILQLLHSLTKQ